MNVEKIMHDLEAKHPGEAEYLQAVREVLISVEDVYNSHPEFEKAKLIERLVEPERIITFRVPQKPTILSSMYSGTGLMMETKATSSPISSSSLSSFTSPTWSTGTKSIL